MKHNNILLVRRSVVSLVALFLVFTAAIAQRVDYQRIDSQRVMSLFAKAKSLKGTSAASYMLFFGRELRGIPYVAKTLDKNSDERLVVNLRRLDCTTFVETVLALSRSMAQHKPTFANYCANLRLIRYKDGIVSYPTRQHYFTYWRQQKAKAGIVRDIQSPNPPFSAVQTVTANYMTTHISQYPMLVGKPEMVKKIAAMEKSITGLKVRYIPRAKVDNITFMRKTVHDGDIIAIVTTKKGLEISHLGIAAWHRDGLHMLNASSLYHKVVEDSNLLKKYLYNQKSALGIRIIRPM